MWWSTTITSSGRSSMAAPRSPEQVCCTPAKVGQGNLLPDAEPEADTRTEHRVAEDRAAAMPSGIVVCVHLDELLPFDPVLRRSPLRSQVTWFFKTIILKYYLDRQDLCVLRLVDPASGQSFASRVVLHEPADLTLNQLELALVGRSFLFSERCFLSPMPSPSGRGDPRGYRRDLVVLSGCPRYACL